MQTSDSTTAALPLEQRRAMITTTWSNFISESFVTTWNVASAWRLRRFAHLKWFVFEQSEVALFAAGDEAFGHRLQLFPTSANVFGLVAGNLVIRGGRRDDRQQIREFLHNLIGGGNQVIRMRVRSLRVANEESARSLA